MCGTDKFTHSYFLIFKEITYDLLEEVEVALIQLVFGLCSLRTKMICIVCNFRIALRTLIYHSCYHSDTSRSSCSPTSRDCSEKKEKKKKKKWNISQIFIHFWKDVNWGKNDLQAENVECWYVNTNQIRVFSGIFSDNLQFMSKKSLNMSQLVFPIVNIVLTASAFMVIRS